MSKNLAKEFEKYDIRIWLQLPRDGDAMLCVNGSGYRIDFLEEADEGACPFAPADPTEPGLFDYEEWKKKHG